MTILFDWDLCSKNKTVVTINTTWIKRWAFITQLSNGDIVYFKNVYDNCYTLKKCNTVLETISEEEYIFRKLAGTLTTEVSVGSYKIGSIDHYGP